MMGFFLRCDLLLIVYLLVIVYLLIMVLKLVGWILFGGGIEL